MRLNRKKERIKMKLGIVFLIFIIITMIMGYIAVSMEVDEHDNDYRRRK